MGEIQLSVIVPVYNTGKFLIRCLESLLNQSFNNLEIIIINDGSTDESYEIISHFLPNNKIVYINLEKNQGLGNARNIGISNAKGKYITFVDSDDWVDLDLYWVTIQKLNKDNADIAVFGIKNEWNNAIDTQNRYIYNCDNKITAEQALCLMTKTNQNNFLISPVVWNKIYRKELLENNNIKFLMNSYWEDDVFSFEVMMHSQNILLVSQVFYHYYQRPDSITNSFSKKHIDDLIKSFWELKQYLIGYGLYDIHLDKYRAMFDRCIISIINMIFHNEQSVVMQKRYINYFYEKFVEKFSFKDAIDYMDLCRIRKLFS